MPFLQMESVDILIKNGHVIDPTNDVNEVNNVAIKNGNIYVIGENLKFEAASIFDASGFIVTPGLIDAHVHCYEYATPLGINPDVTCLSRGVTTVIDAGSSGKYNTLRFMFCIRHYVVVVVGSGGSTGVIFLLSLFTFSPFTFPFSPFSLPLSPCLLPPFLHSPSLISLFSILLSPLYHKPFSHSFLLHSLPPAAPVCYDIYFYHRKT